MSKVKPWQLGVIVVGLLVGVGSVGYFLTTQSEVALAHHITLVDVQDGQLYQFDNRSVHVIIPARHPSTGSIALVRVMKTDAGWKVVDRDLALLDNLGEGVKNAVVDSESGMVKAKSGAPIEYRLPKLN